MNGNFIKHAYHAVILLSISVTVQSSDQKKISKKSLCEILFPCCFNKRRKTPLPNQEQLLQTMPTTETTQPPVSQQPHLSRIAIQPKVIENSQWPLPPPLVDSRPASPDTCNGFVLVKKEN